MLTETSNEISVEEKGEYLLAYEGWGSICVSCEADPKKSGEENEAAYYKYAEEQSDEVIKEWTETYKQTHQLIDSGYEPTGLYGVAWALFKKSEKKILQKALLSRYPKDRTTAGSSNYPNCSADRATERSLKNRRYLKYYT